MPGAPLALHEREEVFRALVEDPAASWASVARRVRRHASTVAREVARGGGRGRYGAATARRRADRCRSRPRRRRLEAPGPLRDQIAAELRLGRSPEAIRADLAAGGAEAPPCTETIYQALYSGALGLRAAECLRSRRQRRRCRQQRNPRSRPRGPNIAARPAAVNDRAEAGHWEADQIIGARNRSSMIWLVERRTRYAIAVTMPDGYTADAALAGLIEGFEQIPAHLRRSVTFDCGAEWAHWPTLAAHHGLDVRFCDPRSPRQRGQVENHNRQARWWFPRGTDLSLVTPADAQHAADILNHQRRRSLNHHSPADLYNALTAHRPLELTVAASQHV